MTNSTFSGNSALGDGGGIFNETGTLHLKNSILANSTRGGDCINYSGYPSAFTHNLIEDNVGCGVPISTADPKLGPLANNGGPTRTFALLSGSPAFDAGDDAVCAAAPVNNLDQRGVARPIGAHCDIGAVEYPQSVVLRSIGAYDGQILESTETSNVGGTKSSTGTTIALGDDAAKKQYRAFLHFDTALLPDNAVITKVMLKIKKYTVAGTDPFSTLGNLVVDIRVPFFGTSAGLDVSDFQASSHRSAVGVFGATPVSNWYTATIGATGYPYINRTGTTQFRLRFMLDDNNDNVADLLKFYSGDYATASVRPILVIEYYVP